MSFIGIALNIWRATPGTGGGSNYSPEARQFFARIADPGAARKNLYAALIDSLVANGIWTQLDILYMFDTVSQATALTNLKSSSFTATAVNVPTFTVDRGFNGDGVTSYLDTNFNPFGGGVNYIQDDAHLAGWTQTDAGAASAPVLGLAGATNGQNIYPRFTDGNMYIRVNDNPETGGFVIANGLGSYLGSRDGINSRQGYKNGVFIGAYGASPSGVVDNENFRILTDAGNFTTAICCSASFGGSLDATEQGNYYSALLAYHQAVGAVP